MLGSFRRGRAPRGSAESTRLICEDGDVKTVESRTKAGPFTYTTIEEVTLFPPERIAFRHVEGPLDFCEEEFTLKDTPEGGTLLSHRGSFIWKRIPLFGWLGGVIYTRPMYHAVIRKHLSAVKHAAEARASRSHVFRRRG